MNKSVQSAVIIQLPDNVTDQIDRIRKVHDRSAGRWPAHINLLYPFVSSAFFPQAAAAIRKVLNQFDSFELTLNECNDQCSVVCIHSSRIATI